MFQCILNVALWNDWSKVTYSQGHVSPALKAILLQSFLWISVTEFAELIQFWQDPKYRRKRAFWRKNLVYIYKHTHTHTHTYILQKMQSDAISCQAQKHPQTRKPDY